MTSVKLQGAGEAVTEQVQGGWRSEGQAVQTEAESDHS